MDDRKYYITTEELQKDLLKINEFEKQKRQILEVCEDHTEYMWAAKIVSILLDCDFRDSKQKLNNYLKQGEE